VRVLALDPYHGGSHAQFLTRWRELSRHDFTLLTLPARKWKWRMRHAAVTFAEQVGSLDASFDALLTTDMMSLAEFRGLAPEPCRSLPTAVYFHENQFAYPTRSVPANHPERDLQIAFTNATSALAADEVWCNSDYCRRTLVDGFRALAQSVNDGLDPVAADRIDARAHVLYPGIDAFPPRTARRPGPLRIVWNHRWEHDKDPETFFAALRILVERSVEFRVSVLGQSFRDVPPIFDEARAFLGERVERWGYAESKDEYHRALLDADACVSTARHEFFGISVLEAVAAGCFPLAPDDLCYPETLRLSEHPRCAHDNTPGGLADALADASRRVADGSLFGPDAHDLRPVAERFAWPAMAAALDDALDRLSS